jgi:RNA polymerase sigma-70 factor, ECF subfamily
MQLSVTRETAKTIAPLLPATDSVEANECELVTQAKAGSTAAFEQLVVRYERRILRLAQNITRNREDAEDVIQDALVKAFTKLSGFRGDSRFYTWLVRITVNEALMGMRRRRWNEVSMDDSTDVDDAPIHDEIEDWGPNPEQCYSQHQLQTILSATIRELRPLYRMVFQLRDVEGLSTRETAQALALSSSAVKTRLQRARFLLRRSLNKYFESHARRELEGLASAERAGAGRFRYVDC